MIHKTCRGPEETRACAGELARRLGPGSVVALHGDLGAGKTCFVQGVAAEWDVAAPVTSPTYTLVNEYPGRLPVTHIDLYRIAGPEEALHFGIEEYMDGPGITLIEWAEHAAEIIPPRAWHVSLRHGELPDHRVVEIRSGGHPC